MTLESQVSRVRVKLSEFSKSSPTFLRSPVEYGRVGVLGKKQEQ